MGEKTGLRGLRYLLLCSLNYIALQHTQASPPGTAPPRLVTGVYSKALIPGDPNSPVLSVYPKGHTTQFVTGRCRTPLTGPLYPIEIVNLINHLVVGGGEFPKHRRHFFYWDSKKYPTFQRIHNGFYACRQANGSLISARIDGYFVLEPAESILTSNVIKADFRKNNSVSCIGTGHPLKSVVWNTAGHPGMTSTLRTTEEFQRLVTAKVTTLYFVGRDVVRKPGTSITVECVTELSRDHQCAVYRNGSSSCPGFRWRHSEELRIDIESLYPCDYDPCPANTRCIQDSQGFTCECPVNQVYNRRSNTCDDVTTSPPQTTEALTTEPQRTAPEPTTHHVTTEETPSTTTDHTIDDNNEAPNSAQSSKKAGLGSVAGAAVGGVVAGVVGVLLIVYLLGRRLQRTSVPAKVLYEPDLDPNYAALNTITTRPSTLQLVAEAPEIPPTVRVISKRSARIMQLSRPLSPPHTPPVSPPTAASAVRESTLSTLTYDTPKPKAPKFERSKKEKEASVIENQAHQ